MKNVGIYRKAFPVISETFISEPAHHLTRYLPTFITCKQLSGAPFETFSVNQKDILGIKQALYLLTRSPSFLDCKNLSKKLNIIHAHFGPDGVYAMELAEKLQLPFLVSFWGYDITIDRSKLWYSGPPLYYQLLWNEEKLKERASAFLVLSKFLYRKMLEKDYPEEKIILHHPGIDIDKFSPSQETAKERYVLNVGRHTEKKGIDTLLKAFSQIASKHPDVTLIQVGSGNLTSELMSLSKRVGLEQRVRFLGAQSYETVQKLMQNAEVFALPSQTAKSGDSEGLPFVILEAMACEIPVASTFHSGIPEAVINGETGFLVSEKDDVALAEKLDILLTDKELAIKMGKQGREYVCKHYDVRKQTKKLEGLYDSLIAAD